MVEKFHRKKVKNDLYSATNLDPKFGDLTVNDVSNLAERFRATESGEGAFHSRWSQLPINYADHFMYAEVI